MLRMIQKVFYGHLGIYSEDKAPHDLNAREHLALWPLIALMLLMGLASPYWTRSFDADTNRHGHPTPTRPTRSPHQKSRPKPTPNPPPPRPTFVDPTLAAGAQGKPAPTQLKGARY